MQDQAPKQQDLGGQCLVFSILRILRQLWTIWENEKSNLKRKLKIARESKFKRKWQRQIFPQVIHLTHSVQTIEFSKFVLNIIRNKTTKVNILAWTWPHKNVYLLNGIFAVQQHSNNCLLASKFLHIFGSYFLLIIFRLIRLTWNQEFTFSLEVKMKAKAHNQRIESIFAP